MNRVRHLFVFTFLLLFVAETFGVYKFVHFCGTEKTSESFYIEKKSCCCGHDAEEADDCCTDETAVIQLKEDHFIVSLQHIKMPEAAAMDLFHLPLHTNNTLTGFVSVNVSKANEPHLLHPKPPLIIQHCRFLI